MDEWSQKLQKMNNEFSTLEHTAKLSGKKNTKTYCALKSYRASGLFAICYF